MPFRHVRRNKGAAGKIDGQKRLDDREANLEVELSSCLCPNLKEKRYRRSTVRAEVNPAETGRANRPCGHPRPFGTALCNNTGVPCWIPIFDGDFHPSELWLPGRAAAHQADLSKAPTVQFAATKASLGSGYGPVPNAFEHADHDLMPAPVPA